MAENPRLRIFAGPNGSGKSTIIQTVANTTTPSGKQLNLGIYINADDIAVNLQKGQFDFKTYGLDFNKDDLSDFASKSGLLTEDFSIAHFADALQIIVSKGSITDKFDKPAQIIARYLREKMIEKKITFSFETVFSHPSNIDTIKAAAAAGYKVYLYMVSTESPEINKFRVDFRVTQKGHNVPKNRIEERYYRCLDLMYDAAQFCHQAYFFDNSIQNEPFNMIAHFKKEDGKKNWDPIDPEKIPNWFVKYYLNKVEK